MNKRMRELLAAMQKAMSDAKACMSDEIKDVEKANGFMAEYDRLKAEYETEKAIFAAEKQMNAPTDDQLDSAKKDIPDSEPTSIEKFAAAARAGFPKDMNEGTAADGGYTVPEDIETAINELREAKYSLLDEVTVTNVTTSKGRRTYKTRAQQTGFTKIGEKGKMPAKNTPKFSVIDYEIEKYGGYFAVTDELLEDSSANITSTLTQWIADESRVTANKLIIAEIKESFSETEFTDLDDIKKALNVTLGQAFKSTSKIFTNDDGLQYLDTLKDSEGNYLLQPNPANPMQLRLCAGSATVPIVVIPNSELETTGNKLPVIIGDMKEAITFFRRKGINIKSSDTAAVTDINAFEQDITLWRATEREDVVTKDDKALVNGYITVED